MRITVIDEWGGIYTNVENIRGNGVNLYINSNEYVSILYYGIDCDLGKKATRTR